MSVSLQAPAAAVGYAIRMSDVPDPEVPAKSGRRRFTAAYKARILAKLDACSERGEIGALLRREGLYSSQVSKWRDQRAAGVQSALEPARRGRKGRDPLELDVARLERENARLGDRLARAEIVIDVQKKLCILLGVDPMTGQDTDRS